MDGYTAARKDISKGWRVARLGDVAEVNPRRPPLRVAIETSVTFLPMTAIGERLFGITDLQSRPFHEVSKGFTYFEDNDVLFAKITPCLQNGKHTILPALPKGFGFGSTEFHVVRARDGLDPRHLFRVLTGPSSIKECVASFTGTAGQQRVQPDVLRSLPILLPPLAEQRAIAAVLDSIDAAIKRTDDVIAATQRLRDALLHEILTHGVPGRHSAWNYDPALGTIPASWEVVRLGDVCKPPEYGAAASAIPYDPNLPRYVRITDITDDGRLRSDDARSADPSKVNGYELHKGDLLFARSGATVGKAYLYQPIDGPCVYAGYLIRFQAAKGAVMAEYLWWFTQSRSYQSWVASMFRAGAQPNINAHEYSSMQIPLPPLEEQQAVAGMLDAVDEAVERAREERSGLQALKASASDALLTGRVRVGIL